MGNKNNVLKYTVKKFSVGTFSVLVGAFIFLAGPALASETNSSENIHKENNVIIDKGNHNESSAFKNVSNEKNIEKSISEDVKVNDLAKKKKDSIRKDVLIEGNGGQNSKALNNLSVVSERESKKQFATDEDLVKISKGLITTEDSKIDNLLFGKEPLKANEDSDGDNVKNSREIYTYEKDGKTYYGYYGHPFLKDTDGDGVIDHDQSDLSKPGDNDNFKWYVTDRDMALFMKLSYRDDSYIKKVLDKDYQWTKADNIVKGDSKPENKYELMHNELSQYWEVDKTYHYDSGLDAVLFKTKSALSIVPGGLVHVLAIRGTKGGKDIGNDVVVAFGQNPQQGKEIEEIIKDIGLREDIKNFYITGHSLGGYLTQRAVVKLHKLANEENGYLIEPAAKKYRDFYRNVFKKATTFNAPKIVASILNRDLYNKSILSKQLAKEGKIKHYGMSGDNVARLLYNDKDVMTYIEKGEHSSNAYFSSILNDDDNFNVGERTGVTGKGKQNSVLKTLKIVEPTTEQVRKIVNENMKISLKDKNPLEILALNKISREKVLEKLNLDNLPKTAILNINIPEGIQPTATTYTLNVAVNYLGKTINTNVGVLVRVLPNFEELKSIKQEAVLESEKKINTDNKTSKIKANYSAKKEELKIKLQKAEELLKNSKIELKVVEINRQRAEFFSQEFPELYVVNGDGTAKDILLEERAAHYDAIATLTGVDEENIITSMFLNNLGVQKNITKINRTSLLEIIDNQDFASIVTPKGIAVDTIMHFIRGRNNAQFSSLEALHHVANGQIETLQFQINEGNKMIEQPLSQLKLRSGVLIAAIIRQGVAIFPSGDDYLEVGDKIIVTTLIQNIDKIYDLLER